MERLLPLPFTTRILTDPNPASCGMVCVPPYTQK